MEYYKYFLSGLLILGFFHQGLAKPTNSSPTDQMQGDDDYNYPDDDRSDTVSDTITTSNTKSTMPPSLQATFLKKSVIEGENVLLQCPVLNRADSNVILWYHGENLLTNQHAIINDRYKLKNTTSSYTLIINKIKMEDAGEYFCRVLPQKLELKVIVNVLPEGSVLPDTPTITTTTNKTITTIEKAKSTNDNSSSIRIQSSYTILVSLVLGMLTYLRI